MEARRRIAIEKLAGGWTQAHVANFLRVHPVTIAKWAGRHRSELWKLAGVRMATESPGHTLDATALVHEAYLRLVGN